MRRRSFLKKDDDNTLILMHFDDSNNFLKDECGNTFSVLNYSPRQCVTNSKFGEGSLTVCGAVICDTTFELDSFTLEAWIYTNTWENSSDYNWKEILNFNELYGDKISNLAIFNQAYADTYYTKVSGPDVYIKLVLNSWNHVAITYDSVINKFKFYVNGVMVENLTPSSSLLLGNYTLVIGESGYNIVQPSIIDEVRLSRGVLYDGDFDVPTTSFEV